MRDAPAPPGKFVVVAFNPNQGPDSVACWGLDTEMRVEVDSLEEARAVADQYWNKNRVISYVFDDKDRDTCDYLYVANRE